MVESWKSQWTNLLLKSWASFLTWTLLILGSILRNVQFNLLPHRKTVTDRFCCFYISKLNTKRFSAKILHKCIHRSKLFVLEFEWTWTIYLTSFSITLHDDYNNNYKLYKLLWLSNFKHAPAIYNKYLIHISRIQRIKINKNQFIHNNRDACAELLQQCLHFDPTTNLLA